MIAFLLNTWNGWPMVMAVGIPLYLVALAFCWLTFHAVVAYNAWRYDRERIERKYEEEYAKNLAWLQQRGQPTESEVVEEIRQFVTEAELKRKYYN